MLPVLLARRPIPWRTVTSLPGQRHYRYSQTTATARHARSSSSTSPPSSELSPATSSSPETSPSLQASLEPRLSLTFTCTVPSCDSTRSSHTFTKRAYERGIVLVECPGCRNRHLIADHLGWFSDGTAGGKHPTVEDMLRAKGEKVVKGRLDGAGGVIEYTDTDP